jgi:hypothetical protein
VDRRRCRKRSFATDIAAYEFNEDSGRASRDVPEIVSNDTSDYLVL